MVYTGSTTTLSLQFRHFFGLIPLPSHRRFRGASYCCNAQIFKTSSKTSRARTRKPAAKAAKAATNGISAPAEKPKVAAKAKTPVKEAPVQEASVEAAPVEEAPAKKASATEAPIKETPVKEAPAEEIPAAAAAEAKDAMETVKAEAEKVLSETIKQASATAKATVVRAYPPAADGIEALFEMQRTALDAWMKAGAVAAKGFEAVGEDLAALNQATMDAAFLNGERLLDCKTLQDVVELQTDFASERMAACLEVGNDLSDKAMKMASEAAAPLEAQMKKALETIQPK